jgi:SAM-dependent methyltransferase
MKCLLAMVRRYLARRRHRRSLPYLQKEFAGLGLGSHAMQKLLDDYEFETVLDIGFGAGRHTNALLERGKTVVAVDWNPQAAFEPDTPDLRVISGDFNECAFDRTFDCIWCCHVLEHQLNPEGFLRKVFGVLREGGVLAITVPPLKHQIVGGHVSLWNAGLLLYRLVLTGFDCSQAHVLKYGYNVSVIVRKRTNELPTDLGFCGGDLRALRHLLPPGLHVYEHDRDDPFDGDILRLNW